MLKVLELSGKGHSLNESLIKLLYKHSYMTADRHIMCVYTWNQYVEKTKSKKEKSQWAKSDAVYLPFQKCVLSIKHCDLFYMLLVLDFPEITKVPHSAPL